MRHSTTRRRRARAARTAAVVAVLMVTIACGGGETGPPPAAGAGTDPGPTAGSGPSAGAPGSASIESGSPAASAPRSAGAPPTFTPGPCPFEGAAATRPDVACGTVTVPERRDRPDGPTVELAVAVLRSPNPARATEPLIYLEGGPGGSALAAVETWLDPPSPLLADRDVILVDQRGTGYSEPRLTCDEEVGSVPDDAGSAELIRALRACRTRLVAAGRDLTTYSTAESAADVDDLRRALGHDRVDLLGVSYGTRLALRVLADHPDGVRSAVLDSVYPVGVKGLEAEATVLWGAAEALLRACRDDAACDAAFGDLQPRLLAALDRLDAEPAPITMEDPETGEPIDVEITGGDVVSALMDALYVTDAVAELPAALDAIADGDVAAGYERLLTAGTGPVGTEDDAADEPPDAGLRPDDSDGLYFSVECGEEVPTNDRNAARDRAASVPEPFGDAVARDVELQFSSCSAWAVPARPATPTRADVPTLLLSGTLDPVTPPAWAEQAASGLSRSRTVVVDGAGHAIIDAGPCAVDLIRSFLRDPLATTAADAPVPACSAAPRFATS